jgi:DNA-binding MurR/RpiR family transcriptional regulator
LGFGSYRDFQHHLHQRALAFATSIDTMQSASSNGDMPDHVRESLECDLKNLQALKNSIDAPRLVALAKRFYGARRIIVIASDLAIYLAQYLEYQTSLFGLPIFAATSAGRIYHLIRPSNKQDLVIGISFRRGIQHTVEGVETAHAKGAYCVGITDTYLSPLSRFCDEVFLSSTESTSLAASYSAPITLFNAIFAACGQYRRQQTLAIGREISEEQRVGTRWYKPKGR